MTFQRDFGMCYVLAKILEYLGCQCLLVNNTNLFSLPVKMWNPDAVFYVTPGKTEKIINHFLKAKLFLFSAEGSVGYKISEAQIMLDKKKFDRLSRIYLWGRGQKKYLLEKFLENGGGDPTDFELKFKIAGNLRGDIIKYSNKDKDKGKISVGFIGSYWIINSIKNRFNIFSYLFENRHNLRVWQDSSAQIKCLKIFSDIIDRLDSSKYIINYRPYPLEDRKVCSEVLSKANSGIKIDDSIDFSMWLAKQDVVISNGITTTVSLMAIVRKPFINLTTLCGINLDIYKDRLPEQLIKLISNNSPSRYEDLFKMLEAYDKYVFYDAETIDMFDELYSINYDGSAILKIAFDILDELNCGRDSTYTFSSNFRDLILESFNYINLKYRKFRNRKNISNDYSFFIWEEIEAKVKSEFDQVVVAILKDPKNQPFLR